MSAPCDALPCVVATHKQGHHATRRDAQRVADQTNAEWRGRQIATVYRCPDGCGAYLITHKGRRMRRRLNRAHRRSTR